MSNSATTALINMRRSPYQTLAALLVLTITFFVGYVFTLLITGSEVVLRYFETQPQITAFFQVDAEPELVEVARRQLEQREYVKEVKIVSKEEALLIYQEDNKDDPLLLQLVTADILPASIEVSAQSIAALEQVELDLQKLDGIDEVVYQRDVVASLGKWTSSLRYIGLAIVGLLGITSILIIMVITGMKISAKRNAIKVMQLIGASKWYIKAPFFFEGVYYGLFGAVFGWVFTYIGLLYITPWLMKFFVGIPLLPVPIELMLIILGGGSLIGILIGGFSSLISSQRLLRY